MRCADMPDDGPSNVGKLPAVEAARAEALAPGVHSADVVLNILARQHNLGPRAADRSTRFCRQRSVSQRSVT